MRAIVLNQNRDELRATGGFPGSLVNLLIDGGAITEMDTKDIYYYDWNLFPIKIAPPPGIKELTDTYGLRDANYEPQPGPLFEDVSFFYQKSGAPSLDILVLWNQGVLEDLLKITGPIPLDEADLSLTSENFSLVMSTIVETKTGKKTSPKDALFRWGERFIKQAKQGNILALTEKLSRAIDTGNISLVSVNPQIQAFFDQATNATTRQWWSHSGNIIAPVFTSLSGNKSDRYMRREISTTATLSGACAAVNTVEITSVHAFSAADELKVRSLLTQIGYPSGKEFEQQVFIQGKGKNRHYLRLYIPLGSQLIESSMAAARLIQTERGELALTATIDTEVGKTSRWKVSYLSPVPNCNTTPQIYLPPGTQGRFTITQP